MGNTIKLIAAFLVGIIFYYSVIYLYGENALGVAVILFPILVMLFIAVIVSAIIESRHKGAKIETNSEAQTEKKPATVWKRILLLLLITSPIWVLQLLMLFGVF